MNNNFKTETYKYRFNLYKVQIYIDNTLIRNLTDATFKSRWGFKKITRIKTSKTKIV